MNTIVFYGFLKDKYGEKFDLEVPSLSDALRMLYAQFPKLRNEIRDEKFYVVRGETFEDGKDMRLMDNPESASVNEDNQTYHIVPIIEGGKKGGILQTILGVVLVVVGYFVPGMQGLIAPGVGLIAGGVATMLSPTPSLPDYSGNENPDERPSYIFNGPLNRQEQGGPVPLIYGECLVGSIIASLSIVNEDL